MIRQAILTELGRRKWNQYRLIKEAGVHPDPVYRFLAGKRDCQVGTIEPLLKVLGITLR